MQPATGIEVELSPPRVSVVVPVLDEAATIEACLTHLRGLSPPVHEVIVVDGGSADETVALAERCAERGEGPPVTVVNGPRGRARQMNRGVELTEGDVVCFLHADTWLPHDGVGVMRRTLADRRVTLGGFVSLMRGASRTRWGTSLHNALKTYYAVALFKPIWFVRGMRLLFGDQAMFCRREDFDAVGGFDDVAIMEDLELSLKLGKRGRVRQVNRICESSDRRVARWGALKANALFIYIGFMWGFGLLSRQVSGRSLVDDRRLARLYPDER